MQGQGNGQGQQQDGLEIIHVKGADSNYLEVDSIQVLDGQQLIGLTYYNPAKIAWTTFYFNALTSDGLYTVAVSSSVALEFILKQHNNSKGAV